MKRPGVNRALVVAGAILLCSLAGLGALRLELDFSLESFFREGEPALAALRAHAERWGADDRRVLVVIESPDALTKGERPAQIAELARGLQTQEGVAEVVDLLSAPPAGVPLPRAILSADGRIGALAFELNVGGDDAAALARVIPPIESAVYEWAADNGVEAGLTGLPAIRHSLVRGSVEDQLRLFPIVAVFVITILVAVLRRARAIALPIAAAFLPVIWLAGTMGWLGEPVGLLNQIFFTLIPAIAVADGLHIAFDARAGHSRARTLRVMAVACALTSLTTALGFAALTLTGAEILERFGAFAALGMVFAWLAAMGAGLLFLEDEPTPAPPGALDRVSDALGVFALARRGPLLAAALVLTAAAAWLASNQPIDFNLTEVLNPTHPVSRASERANTSLAGTVALAVDLEGDFSRDDAWLRLTALEDTLRALPEVRAVDGPATRLRLTRSALGLPDDAPPNAAERAELLLLGDSDDLDALLSSDRARVLVATPDRGATELLPFFDRVDALLVDLAPLQARAAGAWIVAYRSLDDVLRTLRGGLPLVLLLIGLVCLVIFRDLRVALALTWANALPVLVGAAVAHLFGFPLDLGVVVALTIGVGIAVDDTIHLAYRYRVALRRGAGHDDALREGVRRAGPAVLLTSLILSVGFGVHGLSAFPTIRAIGITGAAIIIAAVLSDLFVLVPALSRGDATSPRRAS